MIQNAASRSISRGSGRRRKFQDETFQQAQAFERIAVEVRGKILTR
jgi:hypothetical protein